MKGERGHAGQGQEDHSPCPRGLHAREERVETGHAGMSRDTSLRTGLGTWGRERWTLAGRAMTKVSQSRRRGLRSHRMKRGGLAEVGTGGQIRCRTWTCKGSRLRGQVRRRHGMASAAGPQGRPEARVAIRGDLKKAFTLLAEGCTDLTPSAMEPTETSLKLQTGWEGITSGRRFWRPVSGKPVRGAQGSAGVGSGVSRGAHCSGI